LAEHAHIGLLRLGWEAFRHPHAFTVVLRTPPPAVLARWVLVSVNGFSHLITMPGVTRDQVDEFLTDLAHSTRHTLTRTATGAVLSDLRAAA
jgi:histidine decarboxylase